jgi:hypothetical protein
VNKGGFSPRKTYARRVGGLLGGIFKIFRLAANRQQGWVATINSQAGGTEVFFVKFLKIFSVNIRRKPLAASYFTFLPFAFTHTPLYRFATVCVGYIFVVSPFPALP